MTQDDQPNLSHVGSGGEVRMVDVTAKAASERLATASSTVQMKPAVLEALAGGTLAKGDALATARVAGIQAAKRASEWIPLCHPVPLSWVRIEFQQLGSDQLSVACTAKTTASTGVEMEAMTGAAAAALTIYDMIKSADRSAAITSIQLEHKSGGKSGTFQR